LLEHSNKKLKTRNKNFFVWYFSCFCNYVLLVYRNTVNCSISAAALKSVNYCD
jgi:hypothetical protein